MIKSVAILAAACATIWAQPSLEGNWQGNLAAGPSKLRLVVHITRDSKGEYASTLDSLDQGAMAIPIAKTTVAGNALHLDLKALQATYDATLSGDGASLDGKFTQGVALPLALHRVDKPDAPPARPQTPKPPFPYLSEDVTYPNKAARITLAGTLTIPSGDGPFPAAILITGSGTHDRDETLFGHKPFLVVADYLTRRGIAVLRVDDRRTKSQSMFDDLSGDVLAGVDYLGARKEINVKQIGVIGHSEGAFVGPLAASRSDRIAFVVMLAGMGVTGDQLLLKQGESIVRSQGLGDDAAAAQRRMQESIFAILKEERDEKAAADKIRALFQKTSPQVSDDAINAQVNMATAPEIRAIIASDAAPVLRKLKMPVLALNGSRDIQVPASQNLPAIAAALKEAGNRDFTTTELPNLNHLFQTCKKCTIGEYGELEETFSPDALKILGDWIKERTR
jgi:pimeloyl-ACP methyl ester carboxylesterase